jgi:hypothetical protein
MKYNPVVYKELNRIRCINNEEKQINEAMKLYLNDVVDLEEYELFCSEIIKLLV